MTLGAINISEGQAEIQVDRGIIIRKLDGADRDTRWYGRGRLTINELIELPQQFPTFPVTLSSADIKDNQMIFRGEINIPFEFYGNVGITLHLGADQPPLEFSGEYMAFKLSEHEKYIEHI